MKLITFIKEEEFDKLLKAEKKGDISCMATKKAQNDVIKKEEVTQEVTPAVEPQAVIEKAEAVVEKTEAPVEKAEAPAEKKAEAKEVKKTEGKKPHTMEELLAQMDYNLVVPQKGDSLKGKITSKSKKALIVDLGAKTEGIVSEKEYNFASEFIKELKVGDEVSALVVSSENDRGQVALSLRGAASDAK